MFAPPQAADPQPPVGGPSDQCPIKLHEIRAADFRAFLRLLYPSIVALCSIDSTLSLKKTIRIRELSDVDKLGSMAKLRLARKYAIRQRFLAELEELAQWLYRLNLMECQSFICLCIFRVREQAISFFFQQHITSDINKNAFNSSSFDYQKAISEALKGELDEYKA
ncbi:hypothetical protein FIBSPDRAFT_1039579 [Athelia psychrophila]|uniref:BTB domain-containing protein n=1 Tax=Athelia psychrophila TaxID=1759441 RepID=A0A166RN18_9AGAM|nr:hypothetical protein FIBSPDRAFT_1039579 [Fibularhizoctonia sp. CBS 109695]